MSQYVYEALPCIKHHLQQNSVLPTSTAFTVFSSRYRKEEFDTRCTVSKLHRKSSPR